MKKAPAKMKKKSMAKMAKKSPMKKPLIGKQKNLPKELRDKILASPAKMLKPAAMKLMKKSPAKMMKKSATKLKKKSVAKLDTKSLKKQAKAIAAGARGFAQGTKYSITKGVRRAKSEYKRSIKSK